MPFTSKDIFEFMENQETENPLSKRTVDRIINHLEERNYIQEKDNENIYMADMAMLPNPEESEYLE
jgi:predicted transcriptional regulator